MQDRKKKQGPPERGGERGPERTRRAGGNRRVLAAFLGEKQKNHNEREKGVNGNEGGRGEGDALAR